MRCPECGANGYSRKTRTPEWRCRKCGHEWDVASDGWDLLSRIPRDRPVSETASIPTSTTPTQRTLRRRKTRRGNVRRLNRLARKEPTDVGEYSARCDGGRNETPNTSLREPQPRPTYIDVPFTMRTLDRVERSATDGIVIPGFLRRVGKDAIISQLVDAGFEEEAANFLVLRFEQFEWIPQRRGDDSWFVDCPYCNTFMLVYPGIPFHWLGCLNFYYLVYYFISKRGETKGGLCSKCWKKLPANLLLRRWIAR